MRVTFRNPILLCNLLTLLAVGLGGESSLAQSLSSRHSRNTRDCNCHRWTCPSCQQTDGCHVPSGVDSNPSPGLPEIIHLQPIQDRSVPVQPSPTRPSVSEGFSQNASQFDSSQFNPQSRGRSDQLASRGSNNLNSAIEFQGDYFGVVPLTPTAAQVFQFETTITSPTVGQSILLPENQGTLEILEIADDGTLTLGNPQGPVTNQPDGFNLSVALARLTRTRAITTLTMVSEQTSNSQRISQAARNSPKT